MKSQHPYLYPYLHSNGTVDCDRWLLAMEQKRGETQSQLLRKAIAWSKEYIQKALQSRTTSKDNSQQLPTQMPVLLHGLVIAEILDSIGLDTPSLAAAIIHESAHYSESEPNLSDIANALGTEVASLEQGLEKMHIQHAEPSTEFAENIRRLLLAVAEDVRVVLIRLAEKIADLRLSSYYSDQKQVRIAKDAMEIYAPLANRLGVAKFKWELEDRSLRILQPAVYEQMSHHLGERKESQEIRLQKAIELIEKTLQAQGIEAKIKGRIKPIYSLWKKMQRKGVGFDEIYDVQGIRVLVPTVTDCYTVLGIIHGLWQHLPKEFDDYIANPKPNGYQSLHTAVVDPEGGILEIQIRTYEMHEFSELGIAAHWRYKEGVSQDAQFEKKLNYLRKILKWQEEWKEASAEDLKAELFRDWIYVLTPKGQVIDLPNGSTVLDFAYRVHTEVGHHCRGAKVDGHIVSLNYKLKNGEKVEILTSTRGGPSRDWLNPSLGFLTTARARAKVHHWFRQQDRDKNIEEGRDLLERELKRIHIHEVNYEQLANKLKYTKLEDMLSALGNGDIRITQVLHALQDLIPGVLHKAIPKKAIEKPKTAPKQAEITVAGLGNLMCQMARCCKPVPYDEIIGYITLGKGVSVHRKDCLNVLNASKNKLPRLVQVDWSGQVHNLYVADIKVEGQDRSGLLNDITSALAFEKINVVDVHANINPQGIALIKLSVEIPGLLVLSKALADIQRIPGVLLVERIAR